MDEPTPCEGCLRLHPDDTSCVLPKGIPAWVLWRFKDEEPITRALPCASREDAAFWAAAILEEFGRPAFDSQHHVPRVVCKRIELYPKGRPRIIRMMQLS